MTHAEKVLNETSGEVEFNTAKKEQKVMNYFNKSAVDLKLIHFSSELRSEKWTELSCQVTSLIRNQAVALRESV